MNDSGNEHVLETPAWHRPHRIGPALRKELADWRLWWARLVVVAGAVLAGLTVVGFTWLTERALDAFFAGAARYWWVPLLWTPACAAGIVWCTRRFAAGAAGSDGIKVAAS